MEIVESIMECNDINEEIVETEDIGSEVIDIPFNPTLIKIRRDPFTLGQLVDKIKYNEVVFNTPYQRKDDLWDETAQSRLIESVILKLPLPSFYFDETSSDNIQQIWNVIDGLQRCSAFRNFIIDESLTLQNLEFLDNKYGGLKYSQLPKDLQRRILQTPITTIVVENGTPELVKFNIFKRINTGGLILTPQEIRHAMNQGVSDDLVAKLANDGNFKRATCYRIPSDRMEDQEFIARFVAFYIIGSKNYFPDLDSFMNEGMSRIKNLSQTERDNMCINFVRAMQTAVAIWNDDAFRKRTNKADRRRPLNKTLFEAISVQLAKLSQEDCEKLISKREAVIDGFINLNKESKFMDSISNKIGSKDSVTYRHSSFKTLLTNIIQSH